MIKRIMAVALCLFLLFGILGCNKKDDSPKEATEVQDQKDVSTSDSQNEDNSNEDTQGEDSQDKDTEDNQNEGTEDESSDEVMTEEEKLVSGYLDKINNGVFKRRTELNTALEADFTAGKITHENGVALMEFFEETIESKTFEELKALIGTEYIQKDSDLVPYLKISDLTHEEKLELIDMAREYEKTGKKPVADEGSTEDSTETEDNKKKEITQN